MSETFKWCIDKTRLEICDKQVFHINRYGTKEWYLNGELHRINGPAIEYANGDRVWYLNGKYHREDGPAVEYANGDRVWYLNVQLHRINGPAVEYADGCKLWYLNDKCYSETDYWKELKK